MAHPVKHHADAMLDAVRELILRGGPAAATARAVSAITGAPSGSIYYRFPQRDDLVAAAWLRAQDRFLATYLQELQPRRGAGSGAAVTVLSWSAGNPKDAALLLRYPLRDLLRGEVSQELSDRAADNQRRLDTALTAFAVAVERPQPDVILAVVDLPYTVTRRVLHDARSPTTGEVAALRRAAALLLDEAADTTTRTDNRRL